MARKLAIDSHAVAYAVVNQLLAEDPIAVAFENADTISVTEHLLDAAYVEYLPRARRLVLSFDLSGEASTSGEDLDEPVPFVPDDAPPAD